MAEPIPSNTPTPKPQPRGKTYLLGSDMYQNAEIEAGTDCYLVYFDRIQNLIESLRGLLPNASRNHLGPEVDGIRLPYKLLRLVVKQDDSGAETLSVISQRNETRQSTPMKYRAPTDEESARFYEWLLVVHRVDETMDSLEKAQRLYRISQGFGNTAWFAAYIDQALSLQRRNAFWKQSCRQIVDTLNFAEDAKAVKLYHDASIIVSGQLDWYTGDDWAYMWVSVSEKTTQHLRRLRVRRRVAMEAMIKAARAIHDAIVGWARKHDVLSEYRSDPCLWRLLDLVDSDSPIGPRVGEYPDVHKPPASTKPVSIRELEEAMAHARNLKAFEHHTIIDLDYAFRQLLEHYQRSGLLLDNRNEYPFTTNIACDLKEVVSLLLDAPPAPAAAPAAATAA
ncbi:uncharacterized protein BDV17DRAFT_289332 [Aspergillus undulatus]|uniref:uncharacterized protein n=1 Tax=Aspergillus undulatus TaxID=1810928 RepID=UPI003CCCE7A6